jgi:Flp pilus assembly protein TadG
MNQSSIRQNKRGSATLEASLVLMLFLLVIFTLFDYGFILYMHQTLVNRAAAAARYGAMNPSDTTGIKNLVLFNDPTASDTIGMFGLTASNVVVNRVESGTRADHMTVTITQYGFTFVTLGQAGSRTGKDITVSVLTEAMN